MKRIKHIVRGKPPTPPSSSTGGAGGLPPAQVPSILLSKSIPLYYTFKIENVVDRLYIFPGLDETQADLVITKADVLAMHIHNTYSTPIECLRIIFLLSVMYFLKLEDDEVDDVNLHFITLISRPVLYQLEYSFIQFLWTIL